MSRYRVSLWTEVRLEIMVDSDAGDTDTIITEAFDRVVRTPPVGDGITVNGLENKDYWLATVEDTSGH